MSAVIWYTDKLVQESGTAFSHAWGFGAGDPTSHQTSDTLTVVADGDAELWTVRDSVWKPVSALGYGFTSRDSVGNTVATPAVVGLVETNDSKVTLPVVSSGTANIDQVPAAASITLNTTGVWAVWLYVYVENPTDTTPSYSISVGGTVVANADYPAACSHVSLSGCYVLTTGTATVTFSFPSADVPTTIRTACVKLSDYEA